jgi:hypothetical protein
MSKKEIDIERQGTGRDRKRVQAFKRPDVELSQEVAASIPLIIASLPVMPIIEKGV